MAIVLKQYRPMIEIRGGTYAPPGPPWEKLADPAIRSRLEAAIPSVGKYGFVVGPDLILTTLLNFTQKPGKRPIGIDGKPVEVTFGDEGRPGAHVTVSADELVHVNRQLDVQLLRAKIPEGIKPLSLSVHEPNAFLGHEAALIGFPSSAFARDVAPDVVERLMGGPEKSDIKRLMPGKIAGVNSDTRYAERGVVLNHDASTLAGSGGAPLIDLSTGEVIGIHFAGEYLRTNYAISAWEIARDPEFAKHGVQFAGPLPEQPAKHAPVALAVARSEPVEAPAADVEQQLEDIVLSARPAFPVREGATDWSQSTEWATLLDRHAAVLALATRSVGRLLTDDPHLPWIGTTFLVGDRLALTASYNAKLFTTGSGSNPQIKPELNPRVEFSPSVESADVPAVFRVSAVKFIHPHFLLALLELEQTPPGIGILDLASLPPADLAGRAAAVISFGAPDARKPAFGADSVYGQFSGNMFIQPGRIMQFSRDSNHSSSPSILHDCSTTGGSGGAPLLDLETGLVIGIHTASRYLEAGFAEPTWELARDPHVWDFPIRFRPNPRPEWLSKWDSNGNSNARPKAPGKQPIAARARHWSDTAPIDWTLREPKDLENLLVRAVKPDMVPIYLSNVGLTNVTTTGLAPKLLWRTVLDAASLAAKLQLFVEEIANDESYLAIRDKLLQFINPQVEPV